MATTRGPGPGNGRFDLAVIGGGSAAFAAALRAHELGARTLMVNAGPLGGTCVNVGCVPSKTLLRAAENVHWNGLARFRGVEARAGGFDYATLVSEKNVLVAKLRREKYRDVVEREAGITALEGRARLLGPGRIAVGDERFEAGALVVATGARPARPPIAGVGDPAVWDSTTALAATAVPRRLVVLGGRFVALELSQLFARLGSRVMLLQRSPRILPDEDADVSEALARLLVEGTPGLEIRTEVQVAGVERDEAGFRVRARCAQAREQMLVADAVLAALGRTPNLEGFDALERTATGELAVDERLATSLPGVWAAGDVIGDPQYVYTAAYEGALAAENALGSEPRSRDYSALPWVIFSDPQLAGVGLGEGAARAKGLDVESAKLAMTQVPRALAAHDTRGFVKLVRERGADRLLGARILAPEAGESIAEPSLMLRFGLSIREVARHYHAYLTQNEAMKLALLSFDKDVSRLSCCAH